MGKNGEAQQPGNPIQPSAQDIVRDDSSEGAPFFMAVAPGGLASSLDSQPSITEDLVVEVEFASGAAPVGVALAANTGAFLSGEAGGGRPAEYELGAVLRQFSLQEAQPVFSSEQVRADKARMASLQQAVAMGTVAADQASALERLPPLDSFVRLRFPPGTPANEVTAALQRLPKVASVAVVPGALPPTVVPASPLPSDPLIGANDNPLVRDPVTGLDTQWYLHRTRATQAWRYARGASVVVADIDWGFRITHNDLKLAIERCYNAVDSSNNVTQGRQVAHGTAVLAIAGARANGAGIAGYAPEAALWAVQGDSAQGRSIFREPWAEGIEWVRRTDSGGRRKVIILEVQTSQFGNYEQIPSVHRAIRAAIADGCVVCVAAGNGNRPADRTDKGHLFDPTGSILVGATAYDPIVNKRAGFSNYGSRIVVSAPGDPEHDLTCGQAADNAYRNGFGGTSGATPKVAGTVALMLSVNPTLSHADVYDILRGTGLPLTDDPGKPVGVLLNAEAAVAEALRRRSETGPAPRPVMPGDQASPMAVHGVRRRQRVLVLPEDPDSPLIMSFSDVGAPASSASTDPTGERPPGGDKTLWQFRESVEGMLTQQDRLLIVEQAIKILDHFYVHRHLKEAMHAVRPIQRLRVMQRRLHQQIQQQVSIPAAQRDELAFHNMLTQIFNSVRDLHTSYQLPRPYCDHIAYLPFEVAPFYDGERRRYLVTRVAPGYVFDRSDFGPGAELIYWNGMTIERAVLASAEQTAGSNDAARHARGVSSLTIRPMNTMLPPAADFVELDFVPRGKDADDPAAKIHMRQSWFVRYAPMAIGQVPAAATPGTTLGSDAAPPATAHAAQSSLDLGRESTFRSAALILEPPASPTEPAAPPAAAKPQPCRDLAWAGALGLDNLADSVREARQLIFEPDALRRLQTANPGDEFNGIRGSASPESVGETDLANEIAVKVPWSGAFRARKVTIDGREFGHIQIRTFNVNDPDGLVAEFIRLLGIMPDAGLILDVRGNGGGHIWASERLLQTLCPIEIQPERMQFVVTPGTLDLCSNNPATSPIPLHLWQPSIEEAVETGSVYSHAFPMTDPDSCNLVGQRYYGPVVLIVDGNCYSATDIFAAGFQDHEIGPILGVANSTGAGGANVWEHWLLNEILPSGWGLKPLPNRVGMRVAIRQCLRVRKRAGALLEDFGVVPDQVHKISREDLMHGDRDLLAKAAKLLTEREPRSIRLEMGEPHPNRPDYRRIRIITQGLDRLDLYVDGRPRGSIDLSSDAMGLAQNEASALIGAQLKLLGFAPGSPNRAAAKCIETVP